MDKEKVKKLCDELHEMDMKYDTLTKELLRKRNLRLKELIRECEK